MQRPLSFCAVLLLFLTEATSAQTIAKFLVDAGNRDRLDTPVSAALDGIIWTAENPIMLQEVIDGRKMVVPMQIEEGSSRRLWWILSGATKAGQRRRFELSYGTPSSEPPASKLEDKDGALTIKLGDRPVLKYNYAIVQPSAGVDAVFARGGFIHPLWSVSGEALTTVSPRDHYHHFGIWNPWTKTTFEGAEVDFWNLAKRQGTVRFTGFRSRVSGPVFGGFKALHDHVVFSKAGPEKTAMNEEWDIKVWDLGKNVSLWEFTSTLNCASGSPISLDEYRYAGFGYRATEKWTKENSKILLADGTDRKKADGTRSYWCLVTGDLEKGRGGVLFMGSPSNFNAPEPLRVWPEDANRNRGDVFVNFAPTKNKTWQLVPGREYRLQYRILVFDGELSAAQADAYWQDFGNPPSVRIE